ncbi:MAG TPA: IclR family transcriptional regulator [Acidobacteriaceae bacterium]|nr:IclR family transcriptional regulator [Acidobacteriaceae bacterium]
MIRAEPAQFRYDPGVVRPMLKGKSVRIPKAETAKEARGRDQYFSRAVGKALEVLEYLQAELTPVPMNGIAQRIQLSKTSTFRLLRTLETIGCVTLDGRGQYKLAPGIHAVTPTQWLGKLLRVATPHLHALNRELSETASLAALFENRVEVIAVVESPHVIRMSNVVGHILPPNASSLGKAIVAFQTPELRERLLRSFGTYRFTEHTITDQKELNQEYDCVRLQKFAIDREECAYDGICFCAPIFGAGGQVSAAISSSMPKSRLRSGEHEKAIIAAVRATAEQVALDLQRD